MSTETLGLVFFALFLCLHMFFAQQIYNSRFFSQICATIIIAGIAAFWMMNDDYPKAKPHYFLLLSVHHTFLLILIKLGYVNLNEFLIRKNMLHQKHTGKQFTFVTRGLLGDEYWLKTSGSPSWLDHTLSLVLLFGPMLLVWLTFEILSKSS